MLENLYRSSDVAIILNISRALAYRLLAEGAIPLSNLEGQSEFARKIWKSSLKRN